MEQHQYSFQYEVYAQIEALSPADAVLLTLAKEATRFAYAPYSKFQVGAVANLTNGQKVRGTNQENASYPVGICAERVLLSTVSSLYPGIAIESIAISYHNLEGVSDRPITPCGICRQSLQEYETRSNHSIRLILGGMLGRIYVIPAASLLLPFSFTGDDMS